jgi:hypothetical protein
MSWADSASVVPHCIDVKAVQEVPISEDRHNMAKIWAIGGICAPTALHQFSIDWFDCTRDFWLISIHNPLHETEKMIHAGIWIKR